MQLGDIVGEVQLIAAGDREYRHAIRGFDGGIEILGRGVARLHQVFLVEQRVVKQQRDETRRRQKRRSGGLSGIGRDGRGDRWNDGMSSRVRRLYREVRDDLRLAVLCVADDYANGHQVHKHAQGHGSLLGGHFGHVGGRGGGCGRDGGSTNCRRLLRRCILGGRYLG